MVPPLQLHGLGVARARALRHRSSSARGRLPPRRAERPPPPATMDTLISLGTLAAWLWSTVVAGRRRRRRHLLRGRRGGHDADPARPLPRGSRQAPQLGGDPQPARAGREGGRSLRDGREVARADRRARVGDVFVVRPGEKIATDGVVVRGRVGGRPVDADRRVACRSRSSPGATVTGATVNTYGRLVVRATRVGADTALAQIARLVARRPGRQGAGPAARRPRLRRSSSRS